MKKKLIKQLGLIFGINLVENILLLVLLGLTIDKTFFIAITVFSVSETLILNQTKLF